MLSSDCAIATSGIAGPGGGSVEKPVGTVWIAVRYGERSEAECFCFEGDREQVITRDTTQSTVDVDTTDDKIELNKKVPILIP